MQVFTTFGKFQSEMDSYYKRTGHKLQFIEMMTRMYEKGMLDPIPTRIHIPEDAMALSDEDFDKVVDDIPLSFDLQDAVQHSDVGEEKIIPQFYDVFTIRHPRFTRRYAHSHNYFELDFVVKGTASFYFEEDEHVMHEGEVCIIAPGSDHDFVVDDENAIVYTVCIRKSTFESTFVSLMSHQNLLSGFFRQILKDENRTNYLMLFTGNNMECRIFLRKLLIESESPDEYSNSCSVALINLFFTNLLRNYSKTIAFYNYEPGTDFSLVLQYIQHNYLTLTLSSLAEFFHYSEAHLSTLIKQNTGSNFTDLIRNLRMRDAGNLLLNTDLKINEIADQTGYNSADHFSRVFRKSFGMSPADYRKRNKKESPFIPFSSESGENK